ncbi:hypothetical protein CXG81DRAFT_15065 [Caulochytrium protostelioides]|uniref:4'-phosphopantetheinyl transferase domain-containing protein n=1 Tax=Caulochytrium protostelioides TaxID=1555241 RepID=A0A4P9WZU4_9FUNG|nr:hypothetical protein CXG81DRAFT_15065 [Caulochytrium protostelioides]|eukprot:RKO99064.1 hypothetical protein CXG81DRAFT_15065 [Caulochytrium protostelioides]
MPILGIGVDLVHVPRFVGMLTRRSTSATGTVHAATTPPWEASEAQATLTPVARYLAGRWAAKEAAFKALSGHHTLAWDQCRVLTRRPPADAAGPSPFVTGAHLAITHDGDYVLAQVTIEGHD